MQCILKYSNLRNPDFRVVYYAFMMEKTLIGSASLHFQSHEQMHNLPNLCL